MTRYPGWLTPVLLSLAAAACRDQTKSVPTEGRSDQVGITYLCGNRFELRNQSSSDLLVHYIVLGTQEAGEVALPSGSVTSPGVTRLSTLERGPVQIAVGGEQGQVVANGSVSCVPPPPGLPEATAGAWSAPFSWPVVAVHLHLLPDGRVLSWGRIGTPQVYDPSDGSFTPVPSSTMLFCSGHTYLPDGRLLVSGGHLDDHRGLRDANVFDPSTSTWSRVADMNFARWYPTNTTLPDGAVLSLAGTDEYGDQVAIPELWTGGSWRKLPGASRELPYYPRTFVAPNGLLFYAGELQQTAYLDPAGQGRWIPVASSNYGRRDYGSAVMYEPGKVMIVGGSNPPDGPPTSSAEIIDLNQPGPVWRYTGAMAHPRRQLNATLLPDGEVLVTGGTSAPGFSDPSGAVHAAEVWSPATGQWTLLGSNQVSRVYHSTTLLLPDGRILHAGSGDGPGLPRELTAEIFSPPYLFRGPRPVIEQAPRHVAYGESFLVTTPDSPQVVRATLVRLSSVTHAFDESQRFAELTLTRVAGGLAVQAPPIGAVAPPGPYLLTLLDDMDVPSVSSIIFIN